MDFCENGWKRRGKHRKEQREEWIKIRCWNSPLEWRAWPLVFTPLTPKPTVFLFQLTLNSSISLSLPFYTHQILPTLLSFFTRRRRTNNTSLSLLLPLHYNRPVQTTLCITIHSLSPSCFTLFVFYFSFPGLLLDLNFAFCCTQIDTFVLFFFFFSRVFVKES